MTEINPVLEIDFEIEALDMVIDFELEEIMDRGGHFPYYEGDYEVTPTTEDQILLTTKKSMREDVKVFSIPYEEVSNVYGTTVIIGGQN